MAIYPKFEQKIKDNLITPSKDQELTGTHAIIVSFDPVTNRASVITSQKGSNEVGEIFSNVPCPVIMGIQTAAPRIGYPCWVEFKDGDYSFPVVSHFFNHSYHKNDYVPQTRSHHTTPRFMLW